MARRLLCVVAREQPDLYDILSQRFSGIPEVHVILDRRRGERRQPVQSSEPERRRADRRFQWTDAVLRAHGLVIIRQE